jgi:LacI family transcriptional regulator
LLIETARGFGRSLLSGVSRYAQAHGPWRFHVAAGDWDDQVPDVREWGVQGVIARVPNDAIAQALLESRAPLIAVGLSDEQLLPGRPLADVPEVSPVETKVVDLAIEHLRERHFKHLAFVGIEARSWSKRRQTLFQRKVGDLGLKVHVFPSSTDASDGAWDREQYLMADWLRALPKPLGIFACNDDRGREVLEACYLAGATVPEEVAVLGVDDDEVFCGLSYPPLSSVALNAERAGYRAAELLDAMMAGEKPKERHIVVEAPRVVARRSTEVLAIDDHDVAEALRFIHRWRGAEITVEKVAEQVPLSRRMLEKRFRTVLGRTILEEVQAARLAHAKQLLSETTYPISRVAALAGFASTSYFAQFFQKSLGMTPRKYRNDST